MLNNLIFLFFSFIINKISCNYAGRKWTYQGVIIQGVNVYSRSPFVMYGRGYQILLSGYNRDAGPCMYIDYIYEHVGQQQTWSVVAIMRPPDALPAVVNYGAINQPVLYEGSKYGHWIGGGGTFETKTFFAVTASYDPVLNDDPNLRINDTGSVYIYHGEFSRWTNTQKLRPPELKAGSYFGTCAEICPKNPHNMIIGSEGEQSNSGIFKAGAAYIYRSTPDCKQWSLSQKLLPETLGFQDRFGFVTGIYDEFAFVSSQQDDDNGIDSGSVYIFREERAFGLNLWSQQQKLYSHNKAVQFGEFTSIYGHTLVVGSNQEDDYGGQTCTGAVYVYKTFETLEFPYKPPPRDQRGLDDDPKPKPKPKPMYKWWSFQQRLTARDWHIFRYFGTYTALGGDGKLIATGAFGEAYTSADWLDPNSGTYRTGSAYIFVKDNLSNQWSQQQKFLGPYFPDDEQYYSDPYLHGSDLIIRDTRSGHKYTDKSTWKCLQVAVSDHFGDGWDNAYLKTYAPGIFTKITDHYTPYCDSPNPLKFRYCPLLDEDEGDYIFKLSDDVFDRKFWPEIRWSIMNEKDGKWYYGDARTSIKFHWRMDDKLFDHILNPADKLFVNERCVSCSPDLRPKPKPKSRALKADDDLTRSPTISPAPTVNYVSDVDWAIMKMVTTNPNGWYGDYNEKNGTGTSYYIYDNSGKVLIYTGTICGTTLLNGQCKLEIEDGDFILRVGGAIDRSSDGHTWEFCGITGGAQEMVTFTVKDRQCIPYTRITAKDYCWANFHLDLGVSGIIELTGVISYYLTQNDLDVIAEALKSVTSVQVSSAKVELIESNGLHPLVKFTAFINPSSDGYSALSDADSWTIFELYYNELESLSTSGKLTSNIVVLSQMTRSDSNYLFNLQNAKVTSLVNSGPNFHDLVSTTYKPINFLEKEVKLDNENEPLPTKTDEVIINAIKIESNLGYALIVTIGLVLVGVAWRLSVRDTLRKRKPYQTLDKSSNSDKFSSQPFLSTYNDNNNINNNNNNSNNNNEFEIDNSSTPILHKSSSTTRYSSSHNVISHLMTMKDDLKRHADIEDKTLPLQVNQNLDLLQKQLDKNITS